MPYSGDLPGIMDTASLVYYNGKLLLDGSSYLYNLPNCTDHLYAYDLSLNTWSAIKPINQKNCTSYQTSHIYHNYMYSIFGVINSVTTKLAWRLELNTYTWEYLGPIKCEGYILYGYFQINSTVYLSFGRNSYNVTNSIFSLDLSHPDLNVTVLSKDYTQPNRRRGHCMVKVQTYLLLFGGVAEDGITYYNDIWTYEPDIDYWSKLTPAGNGPSARSEMSCTYDSGDIYVYGGKDGNEYFSDMYYFKYNTKTWLEITIGGNTYAGRCGSCLVISNVHYIVYGSSNGIVTNSILVYSSDTNTITKATSLNTPTGLMYMGCWIEAGASFDTIYVVGGEGLYYYPNSYVYKIIIQGNQHTGIYNYTVQTLTGYSNLIPTRAPFIKSGNYGFTILGSVWYQYVSPSITIYDLTGNSFYTYPLNQTFGYENAGCLYGKDIYIFGGGDNYNTIIRPGTAVSRMYKISNTPDDIFHISCSDGTFGLDCEFCPEGSYEKKSDCLGCPAGTYSNIVGATSVAQCTFCPQNTFNDKVSSTYCKQCPSSENCPIGCTSPYISDSIPDSLISNQPVPYASNNTTSSYITPLSYALGGFILFVLGVILILTPSYKEKVKRLDIYISSHDVKVDKPLIPKKTTMGGFFSIAFLISTGLIILSLVLSYVYNNISETKTLVPSILYQESVKSPYFCIEINLYQYGSTCQSKGSQDCPDAMYVVEGSMSYTSRVMYCQAFGSYCKVSLTYTDLGITFESTVELQLSDSTSYAAYIQFNITSFSSIPNSMSNIQQLIKPSVGGKVFKGPDFSSISLLVTPSVWLI